MTSLIRNCRVSPSPLAFWVYADNAAGIALYEKFGFAIEGTHRLFAFRNGEYVDAYSMARIKLSTSEKTPAC